MKILEAQNALLSNFEVYEFLAERQDRIDKQQKQKKGRRGPANLGNLETLTREVLQYFRSPPGPLSEQPIKYSAESITQLVERLGSYGLAKGELIMVLNMRPATPAQLHACIEEVENRMTEEQQAEILDIVAEVLGHQV